MVNWLSPGARKGGLEEIERRFSQMLEDGRHVFDAASNALLGGTDPEVIREDLFQTDRRINATEQEIRRKMVVHGSVYGATSFPGMLVMMSLTKDAERIGDYAKNIFDVAMLRPEIEEGERKSLVVMKDEISRLIVRAQNVYENQDSVAARALLAEADRLEDQCDGAVARLLKVKGQNAAGAALAYRYFKRVMSHVANVVTSLVMPLDKLDFFDEPKGS